MNTPKIIIIEKTCPNCNIPLEYKQGYIKKDGKDNKHYSDTYPRYWLCTECHHREYIEGSIYKCIPKRVQWYYILKKWFKNLSYRLDIISRIDTYCTKIDAAKNLKKDKKTLNIYYTVIGPLKMWNILLYSIKIKNYL